MNKGDSVQVRTAGKLFAGKVKTISNRTAGVTIELLQDTGKYRKGEILQVMRYECKTLKE